MKFVFTSQDAPDSRIALALDHIVRVTWWTGDWESTGLFKLKERTTEWHYGVIMSDGASIAWGRAKSQGEAESMATSLARQLEKY